MKELFKGKPEHYLTTGKTIEVDSSLIRNVDTNMNTVKQREKIEAMKRAEARVAELEARVAKLKAGVQKAIAIAPRSSATLTVLRMLVGEWDSVSTEKESK
jgi:hypothetical protein